MSRNTISLYRYVALCCHTVVYCFFGCLRSWESSFPQVFPSVPDFPPVQSSPTASPPDVPVKSSVPANEPQHTPTWRHGSSALTIMMIGRHSSGKSTLMEGLTGQSITSNSGSEDEFTIKTFDVNNIHLTLSFLRSIKENLNLEELSSHFKRVDVAMYAIRMDDSRARPTDTRFLRKLHSLFGRNLWSKAIFVLTFANRVQMLDRNHVLQRSESHYKQKLLQWKEVIHKILLEEGLSQAEVQDIPVVPVGHSSEKVLFEQDWTVDFVNAMYKRLTESSEQELFKVCKYC